MALQIFNANNLAEFSGKHIMSGGLRADVSMTGQTICIDFVEMRDGISRGPFGPSVVVASCDGKIEASVVTKDGQATSFEYDKKRDCWDPEGAWAGIELPVATLTKERMPTNLGDLLEHRLAETDLPRTYEDYQDLLYALERAGKLPEGVRFWEGLTGLRSSYTTLNCPDPECNSFMELIEEKEVPLIKASCVNCSWTLEAPNLESLVGTLAGLQPTQIVEFKTGGPK